MVEPEAPGLKTALHEIRSEAKSPLEEILVLVGYPPNQGSPAGPWRVRIPNKTIGFLAIFPWIFKRDF